MNALMSTPTIDAGRKPIVVVACTSRDDLPPAFRPEAAEAPPDPRR